MLDQSVEKVNRIELSTNRFLDFTHPKVMGILNATPDSFSDGGKFLSKNEAVDRIKKMIDEGANIIDIGGESSRPGSDPVDLKTELERVIPVIREIRTLSDIPISIDTTKSEVASQALDAGADIVNDISALRFDKSMTELVSEKGVPVILMHMLGKPKTMQHNPNYSDCVHDIQHFFSERLHHCLNYGIPKNRIIIDPGIGFGKRLLDNLAIFNKLNQFGDFGCPVLVGASRKSFIVMATGIENPPEKRIGGSLAAALISVIHGADIVRVHDVAETVEALKIYRAIREVE